jgi:type II secretory pathway component PulF
MEDEILKKIEEQDEKLDEIYKSVETTRKYFLVALIITVVAIILPLIGLMFIIPKFLDIYANIGI